MLQEIINNKGSWCLTSNIICQEGYCSDCWIAKDDVSKIDYLFSYLFGGVVSSVVLDKERHN